MQNVRYSAYFRSWAEAYVCNCSVRKRRISCKISALLGHSSVNTTFEFYVDIMEENTRIMDFMNKEFLPEPE